MMLPDAALASAIECNEEEAMTTTSKTRAPAERGVSPTSARRQGGQGALGTRGHGVFLAAEVLLAVLVAALAVAVKGHPGPLPGDVGATLDLQHALLPHQALTALVDSVSTINWPQPSAVALVAIVLVLLVSRRWLDALFGVLTAVLGDLSSYLLNEVVQRPRPNGYGVHVLRHITNYFSFPSGHVVHAFAFFGFLLFLSVRSWSLPAGRLRSAQVWSWALWAIRVVLIALIVLMGPSRVLEGEHWPSDVVGGALTGAFWLVLGAHLYPWAQRRWPRPRHRPS